MLCKERAKVAAAVLPGNSVLFCPSWGKFRKIHMVLAWRSAELLQVVRVVDSRRPGSCALIKLHTFCSLAPLGALEVWLERELLFSVLFS